RSGGQRRHLFLREQADFFVVAAGCVVDSFEPLVGAGGDAEGCAYLLVSVALRRLWFHGTKAGIGDRCTEATTLALALLGFRAFQLGDPATSGAICFSANRRISLSSLWVALSIRLSRR
ncbi:hypothetical protein, partial [Mycobacterium tuberculosis]